MLSVGLLMLSTIYKSIEYIVGYDFHLSLLSALLVSPGFLFIYQTQTMVLRVPNRDHGYQTQTMVLRVPNPDHGVESTKPRPWCLEYQTQTMVLRVPNPDHNYQTQTMVLRVPNPDHGYRTQTMVLRVPNPDHGAESTKPRPWLPNPDHGAESTKPRPWEATGTRQRTTEDGAPTHCRAHSHTSHSHTSHSYMCTYGLPRGNHDDAGRTWSHGGDSNPGPRGVKRQCQMKSLLIQNKPLIKNLNGFQYTNSVLTQQPI
uniref:Uncharacterized protein n=1 Tax=Paramormyrops kingsleyae TaxID=1676925 RepID=A0A3B3RVF4_9TELE